MVKRTVILIGADDIRAFLLERNVIGANDTTEVAYTHESAAEDDWTNLDKAPTDPNGSAIAVIVTGKS